MPVIDPWLIYWIETLDTTKKIIGILIFVFIIGIFAIPMFSSTVIISLIIMIVAEIIIPSKDTCYKMLIAKHVTYERVDKISETVEKVYKDIKRAIQEK